MAMSGQLVVVALTSPAPSQPISVTVIMLVPPLLRIVNVSSLTLMRQVLLSAAFCSGAGVIGVDEAEGVCGSSAGVETESVTGGAGGVGAGVSTGSVAAV